MSHLLLEACKMAIEAHLCRTEANNGEYMELFSTDELPLVVSRLFDNIIQSYLNNGNINELGLILRKCVDW